MASANSLTAKLKIENQEAKKTIKQLKQDIQGLKAELRQVGKEANSSSFKNGKNNLGGLDDIIKKLTGTTSGWKKGLLRIVTSLAGLGATAGVTKGVIESFKTGMENSNSVGDEFERIQNACRSAVDYFKITMGNVDFSAMRLGLLDTIKFSNDLSDALDRLMTKLQAMGVIEAKARNELATVSLELSKLDKDDPRREALLQKRIDIIKNLGTEYNKLADEERASARATMNKAVFNSSINQWAGMNQLPGRSGANPNLIRDEWIDAWATDNDDFMKTIQHMHDQWSTYASKTSRTTQPAMNQWDAVDQARGATEAAQAYAKINAEREKGIRLGNKIYKLTEEEYYALASLADISDNGDESAGKKLREYKAAAEAYEAMAKEQEAAANEQLRMQEKRDRRAATRAKKNADQIAKHTYTPNPKTVGEIEANITALKEKMQKVAPDSEEFKKVSAEIKVWQNVLDRLKFGDPNTLKGMKDRLDAANRELEELVSGTDEWNAKLKETKELTQKIEAEELSKLLTDLTENANTQETINRNIEIYNKQLEKAVVGSEEELRLRRLIREEEQKLVTWKKGSVAQIDDLIGKLQEQLNNENLTISARIELENQIGDLENQIQNKTDTAYIKAPVKTAHQKRVAASKQNAEDRVEGVLEARNRKINPISAKEAKKEIAEINTELAKIGLDPIIVHVETDFEKEFAKFEQGYGTVMNAAYAFDNLAGSIENIKRVGDEGGSVLEMLFAVMQFGEGVIAAVNAVMEIANMLGIKKAATDATGAGAMTAKAAAATEEMATDSASIAPKMGEAAANKVLTASLLELASASIFAAHASIPFAGVGIATGMVSGMLAAMAAAKASIAAMAAFANGGIVDGTALTGDNTLIRANKGEMVLNQTQQGNLFRMIDSGGLIGNMAIQFKLRGEDLVGSVSNHSSKHGITNGKRVQMR